jgi:hypothetical protein
MTFATGRFAPMMDFEESTTGFAPFVPVGPDMADTPALWTEEGPMFAVSLNGWVAHGEDGELEYAVPPFAFILGRISMLRDVN